MKDINKIIDSLSPVEQNMMYNALQKKLNRSPKYTIRKNGSRYSIKPNDKYENANHGTVCSLVFETPETLKNVTIGNCYLDIWNDRFVKIIAIDNDEFCSMVISEYCIERNWFTVEDVKNWKKITSHQFKDIYLAIMKDIRDPDLDYQESNWLTVYKSIMNSINS